MGSRCTERAFGWEAGVLREHQIGDGTDHWLLDLVLDCMYIDHVSTFFSQGDFEVGRIACLPGMQLQSLEVGGFSCHCAVLGGCQVQAKMCKIE
jgi:hypothetical protein